MSNSTSNAVYAGRLQRAQAELQSRNLDALLVGPGSDLFYLLGFNAHLSERLNLLIIPKSGRPAYIAPVLEAPLVQHKSDLVEIHAWEETASPSDLAAKVLGAGPGAKLAVGDQLWSVFLLRLQSAVPSANWTSSNDVMKALRMSKDAYEIDCLSREAELTDQAWHEFIEGGPISGLTESQAMARLSGITESKGLTDVWGLCASGPNAASPHHHTGDRVIQSGDSVIFDWGGSYEGYRSDVTRTVFIGAPSDEQRKVYEIVLRANQATLDAVKPGVPCEALDKAARDIISEAGYGPAFLHRVGHGLGLDVHEEPYLVSGNKLPLAAGMCFSDEPGIYLEGKFGVRVEDAVICLERIGLALQQAHRDKWDDARP